MALCPPTRAVGKAASGQANSGQVPPSRGPGVRRRPPLAESGPLPPASCSAWALSPSWGLCGESLTPDTHLSAAALPPRGSLWPPGLCWVQGESLARHPGAPRAAEGTEGTSRAGRATAGAGPPSEMAPELMGYTRGHTQEVAKLALRPGSPDVPRGTPPGGEDTALTCGLRLKFAPRNRPLQQMGFRSE